MTLDNLLDFAPKFFSGCLVFAVTWFISYLIPKLIDKTLVKIPQISDILERSIRTLILLVGILCGLGTMGVDVSALVAGLGLTGFAIGFALKDSVSNLVSGILLLLYQPFSKGDEIEVGKYVGVVLSIDLRYTTLRDNEKLADIILIPNSNLFTNTLVIKNKVDAVMQQLEGN